MFRRSRSPRKEMRRPPSTRFISWASRALAWLPASLRPSLSVHGHAGRSQFRFADNGEHVTDPHFWRNGNAVVLQSVPAVFAVGGIVADFPREVDNPEFSVLRPAGAECYVHDARIAVFSPGTVRAARRVSRIDGHADPRRNPERSGNLNAAVPKLAAHPLAKWPGEVFVPRGTRLVGPVLDAVDPRLGGRDLLKNLIVAVEP